MNKIQNNLFVYNTLLNFACGAGNIELVKYLISLDKIDINSTNIFDSIYLNEISIVVTFLLRFKQFFFVSKWCLKILLFYQNVLSDALIKGDFKMIKYLVSLNKIDLDHCIILFEFF